MAKDACALIIFRGDSYPITFTLRDKATQLPIDLTGATAVLTVDTLPSPPDDTTKLFSASGVLSGSPTDGTITFTPSAVNTDQAVGTYYYDVQVTWPNGQVRTVAKSTLAITMDITK